MKKSRIAKFALLGASAAALAATLSTSTYAWYVSNKTANVEAVTGSTASGQSDNTIALSISGVANDYHKTIQLANKTNGLMPLVRQQKTLNGSGTKTAEYYALNETTSTVGLNANTATSGWYEYEFYMLASVNCNVSTTLTVTNTTADFSTLKQINYSGGYQHVASAAAAPTFEEDTYYKYENNTYVLLTSEPTNWATTYTDYYVARTNKITGVGAGEKFTVDALQACMMSLAVETGTAYANDSAAYAKADTTTAPTEYVGALTAVAASYTAPTATGYGSVHASAGAHDYYEFMTSKTLDSAVRNVDYTSLGSTFGSSLSLTAGVPVRLVYSIWLDGSNDICFNACQGQTLSVAFDYTATPQ